jgi:hypothetical protein
LDPGLRRDDEFSRPGEGRGPKPVIALLTGDRYRLS